MYKTIDTKTSDIVCLSKQASKQTNGILCKNGGGTILMF